MYTDCRLSGEDQWIVAGYNTGELRIWDFRQRSCVKNYQAHEGPSALLAATARPLLLFFCCDSSSAAVPACCCCPRCRDSSSSFAATTALPVLLCHRYCASATATVPLPPLLLPLVVRRIGTQPCCCIAGVECCCIAGVECCCIAGVECCCIAGAVGMLRTLPEGQIVTQGAEDGYASVVFAAVALSQGTVRQYIRHSETLCQDTVRYYVRHSQRP